MSRVERFIKSFKEILKLKKFAKSYNLNKLKTKKDPARPDRVEKNRKY